MITPAPLTHRTHIPTACGADLAVVAPPAEAPRLLVQTVSATVVLQLTEDAALDMALALTAAVQRARPVQEWRLS